MWWAYTRGGGLYSGGLIVGGLRELIIYVSQRLFINLVVSPSRVYCIFTKSTNSNFQFTLLFESRGIGDFPKTLLLVSWAKIQ